MIYTEVASPIVVLPDTKTVDNTNIIDQQAKEHTRENQ